MYMRISKQIIALCLAGITILSGLFLSPDKVKADVKTEQAIDGSKVIESQGYGEHLFGAYSDGKNIYYSINSGSFKKSKYNTIKRNITTGKETGVLKGKKYGYYGFDSLKLYKNYFLGVRTNGSNPVWRSIYKVTKDGKVEELAIGRSPVVSGNSIYYIAEKVQKYGDSKTLGIYKMDMDGGHKKPVKKGKYYTLGLSGENMYYSRAKYAGEKLNTKWFDFKTGKEEKKVVLSQLYDASTKTKLVFSNKELRAGTYKDGKWEYKTILTVKKVDDNYMGIVQVRLCGSKALVQINDEAVSKIYMIDLDGKNKELLKEFILVG